MRRSRVVPLVVIALCLLTPGRALADAGSAAKEGAATFTLRAGSSFCKAVWSDGADRIAFACGEALRLATRGEADSKILGVLDEDVLQIAGVGRGARIALAAAGEKGHAARYRGGVWQEGRAPCPAKVDLVAAAIDSRGQTWYAGRSDGLYLWGQAQWKRFPYPAARLRVTAMVAGGGGALYLAGKGGELLRFDGRGAFSPVKAAGLPGAAERQQEIKALWFGRHSGLLYAVSASKQLYSVAPARGVGRARKLDVSWVTAMTGRSTPRGDLLLIAGPGKLIGYHRGALFQLEGRSLTFPKQMTLIPADRRLYAACSGRGVAVRAVDELFDPGERQRAAERTEQERERTTTSFGLPRTFLLSFYLNMGPAVALAAPELAQPETETSFALDLELGARLPFGMIRSRLLMLWPTVGYSYAGHDALGGHLFAAGLGLSAQLYKHFFGVTALSRFLVGGAGGHDAIGTRNGLRFEVFFGIVSLEASHQLLYLDPGRSHDVRVMLGTDLMMWWRYFTLLNVLINPSASSGKLFWRSLWPIT